MFGQMLTATTTSGVSDALTTALSSTAGELASIIAVILPIGLGVFSSLLCVRYGKNFFKALIK